MKRSKREHKSEKKHNFKQWIHSDAVKCALVTALTSAVLLVLLCVSSAPQRYDVQVGSIAHQTITATKQVVDEIATEAKRKAAADAVELTYHPLEGASDEVLADLDAIFSELRAVQQYGLTLRKPEDTDDTVRFRNFSDEELAYAQSLVSSVSLSKYQCTTLMRTSSSAYEIMVTYVTIAVGNTLNTSVREGQISQAIETIKQVAGYRVDLSLVQNIVPVVLRKCMRANMVVDQEAAETARQRAREAVEPVVYQQGQTIVRDGEVVTSNQFAVLLSLGLMQNQKYDYTIYLGVAVSLVAGMTVLLLMQGMLDKKLLHDLRRTLVVMCTLVFSVSFCVVAEKLLNVYAMPVTMAGMLLAGLLGSHVGISSAVSMAVIISGLTAAGGSTVMEMVLVPMCALISGIVSVRFLRDRPSRVRVILCGVLNAVINAVVMAGFVLMTSNDLTRALINIYWSMGGAVLGSALVLALQPVFEAAFNLATPNKLMELANPNQPLLKRLLIEAPGTYHHSIIVANLAEAAAEKIGANPLMARTGAYFHDIGKLKRPLYFKENQMGENPHDTTDPYVSAAIVTTHTRDGLLLAQKHHLPPEIQEIIVEHHGDTPVMFFYSKAKQLAGDKPVNIDDFRYDGKRPTTKEAAIIMLADTVEAAVRSMPDPTPETIARFIEKLVRGKLEDGQLSESPLTLRDIDGICEAFGKVLNGVFHERIEYPSVEAPKRMLFSIHAKDKESEAKKQAAPIKREEKPAEKKAEEKAASPAAFAEAGAQAVADKPENERPEREEPVKEETPDASAVDD